MTPTSLQLVNFLQLEYCHAEISSRGFTHIGVLYIDYLIDKPRLIPTNVLFFAYFVNGFLNIVIIYSFKGCQVKE